MEKLFREVATEDGAKTYEEVPVFKSYGSEEDYNKSVQSVSSKAKGEILSELGIKSVAEFKEKYKGAEELETLQSQLTEKESLLGEKTTALTELESKYKEAVNQKNELSETIVLSKYQVPDTFKEDFKTLVKAGVNEEKTFEQSAEEVYKRLNITQVKNKIQIGGDQHDEPPLTTKEENERLQKL